MIRRLVGVLGAALILFHAWLFGSQWWDGQLSDPTLLARWVIALGLVAGLVGIRRQGGSTFDRRGVAIWLLAVLLHGPAVSHDLGRPALPEVVATLAEAVLATAAGIGLGLLLAQAARRAWPHPHLARQVLVEAVGAGPRPVDARFRYGPRPPPRS